jgi:hypothetical protein
LAKVKDPIERIRQAGHLYIRFAVKHPNHYRLMFMTPMDAVPAEDDQECRKGNPEQDAYAFLLHSVQEALLARRFAVRFKDSRVVAQTFWAVVHGVASLEITMGQDNWMDWAGLEERASAAIDATIHGMGRPGATLRRRKKAKSGDA